MSPAVTVAIGHRTRARLVLAAVALGLLVACQEHMAEPWLVDKLRIIGVRAGDPEMTVSLAGGPRTLPAFSPGATTLTALVADPKGGGRSVNLVWSVCTLQGIGEDATDFNCDGDNGLPLAGNVFNPAVLIGALYQKGITFDLALTEGYGASLESGVPVYVWLRVYAGSETTVALKRIVISSRADRNRNPRLTGVLVDGTDITTAGEVSFRAARDYTVKPMWDAASLDKYYDEVDGVTKTEEPFFSWFSTEGEWRDVYTHQDAPENRWRAPALTDSTPRPVAMWFVMHDQRGGVDWYALRSAMIVP